MVCPNSVCRDNCVIYGNYKYTHLVYYWFKLNLQKSFEPHLTNETHSTAKKRLFITNNNIQGEIQMKYIQIQFPCVLNSPFFCWFEEGTKMKKIEFDIKLFPSEGFVFFSSLHQYYIKLFPLLTFQVLNNNTLELKQKSTNMTLVIPHWYCSPTLIMIES